MGSAGAFGRWFGPVVGLAALIAAIAFMSSSEKGAVPEDPSSPGFSIIRDPDVAELVDSREAVEPDSGWDTQYDLNDGEVIVRFRDDEMDVQYRRYAEELAEAVSDAAESEGFQTGVAQ